MKAIIFFLLLNISSLAQLSVSEGIVNNNAVSASRYPYAISYDGVSEYLKIDNTNGLNLLGSNLMLNGNFETYTGTQDNGLTATYTGWSDVNGSNSVQASSNYDTLRGGTNSLKLSGATFTGWVRQTITVISGKSYALKFWMKGDGTNKGRYAIYDASNSTYIQAIIQAGSATSWTEVSRLFTAPIGCTSIQINFLVGSPANAAAYFDHAYFREIKNIAIMFTFKISDTTRYKDREYLFDKYYGDYNRCWNFRTIGTNEGSPSTDFGKLSFGFGIDGSSSFATGLYSISPLAIGVYNRVVLTLGYNGSAIAYSMYLNGALQSSATSASAPFCDDTVTVYIATVRNASTLLHYFKGDIGETQIVADYSPTASEILSYEGVGFPSSYSTGTPLFWYNPIDTASINLLLKDYSNNGISLSGTNIAIPDDCVIGHRIPYKNSMINPIESNMRNAKP